MAYGNFLASVSEQQVNRLKDDPSQVLDAGVVVVVSHLMAYWVRVQPLGGLLGEAIDGGTVLSEALWHPLRPPVFHSPTRVVALFQSLAQTWEAISERSVPDIDWFKIEIEQVLKVFGYAAEHGECVVSVLEPPRDGERANRVHVPLRVDSLRT